MPSCKSILHGKKILSTFACDGRRCSPVNPRDLVQCCWRQFGVVLLQCGCSVHCTGTGPGSRTPSTFQFSWPIATILWLILVSCCESLFDADIFASHSLHYELHWLDVPERIQFRVATTVYRCLHNMAPRCLSEMCTPIATSACRQGLRLVTTSNLVILRVRRVTYGSRAFSVAGPVCWNGLPDYLKSPDLSFDCFKRQLKTFLFCTY